MPRLKEAPMGTRPVHHMVRMTLGVMAGWAVLVLLNAAYGQGFRQRPFPPPPMPGNPLNRPPMGGMPGQGNPPSGNGQEQGGPQFGPKLTFIFKCSRCGAELGRGNSPRDRPNLDTCPHCGAKLLNGIGQHHLNPPGKGQAPNPSNPKSGPHNVPGMPDAPPLNSPNEPGERLFEVNANISEPAGQTGAPGSQTGLISNAWAIGLLLGGAFVTLAVLGVAVFVIVKLASTPPPPRKRRRARARFLDDDA
jgi:DNA-directed RNA polymerase subunit RPC12/RpoP